MPAKLVARPKAKPQLVTGTLVEPDPEAQSRLLSELADAHVALDQRVADRDVITGVTLTVGVNRVNHGLGRRPKGCSVMPTVADATWAWGFTSADDKQVTITTVGVPQPNATIEVF